MLSGPAPQCHETLCSSTSSWLHQGCSTARLSGCCAMCTCLTHSIERWQGVVLWAELTAYRIRMCTWHAGKQLLWLGTTQLVIRSQKPKLSFLGTSDWFCRHQLSETVTLQRKLWHVGDMRV